MDSPIYALQKYRICRRFSDKSEITQMRYIVAQFIENGTIDESRSKYAIIIYTINSVIFCILQYEFIDRVDIQYIEFYIAVSNIKCHIFTLSYFIKYIDKIIFNIGISAIHIKNHG